MCAWRIARQEDLSRLWPVVRGSHVLASLEDLQDHYRNGPWRVRVSDTGDAALLATWRLHLRTLALKGVWSPPHRMSPLLDDALAVARAQGFESLLSPLLPESMYGPYLEAGMSVREELVVLQGLSSRSSQRVHSAARLRRGHVEDAEKLAAADALCFDDFWRHGPKEWAEAVIRERVILLEGEDGLLGYASSSVHGSVCTLGRLGVVEDARRQGVGRFLVNDVLNWAAHEGVPLVSLCTQRGNDASRALYASAGLVEVEEPYALLAADVGTAALSDTL